MTDTNSIRASIRAELADLPEQSVRKALEFYEEYVADAVEAGHTVEEVLQRIGGAKEIAAQIRAEAALDGAEANPGPLRLIGARRQVRKRLARSAARVSMVLGASLPYTFALTFYLVSIVLFVGAVAAAALMGYEITTMHGADTMTKIGAGSAGVFAAGLLSAVALGFLAAARGITRVTLRKLRSGLRRGMPAGDMPEAVPPRTRGLGTAALILTVVAFAGFGGTFPSGLPTELFSIWNSMKPADLNVRTWSFPAAQVRQIQIATLNSAVILESSSDLNAIGVTYEEPKWLTGTPVAKDGRLAFREMSSGAIPFMDFIAMHEGTTSLKITVPRGYRADSLVVSSHSGSVSLSVPGGSVRVDTGSGNIHFDSAAAAYRMRATAPAGRIIVKGKALRSTSYEAGAANGATVDLATQNGTVEIR